MLRAFRRVQQYIKHDIKEIVAPSALPEPPGQESRRLTVAEIWKVSTQYESLHWSLSLPAQLYFCVRHLCECKSSCSHTVQAVRLGTRDYLDTFKKTKKEEVAGGSKDRVPEEPPIIDELRESPDSLLACSLHVFFAQLQCFNATCIISGPQVP